MRGRPAREVAPFEKGSILNFFDYFSDSLRTYARVFTFGRATQNSFCSIHSTLLILSVKDKIGSVAELVPQHLFYLIVFVRQGQIRQRPQNLFRSIYSTFSPIRKAQKISPPFQNSETAKRFSSIISIREDHCSLSGSQKEARPSFRPSPDAG